MPDGEYRVAVALVDPATREPRIHLAVEGERPDGWLDMGMTTLRTEASKGR